MFSLIRTTATMNAWHNKVNPYSCHLKKHRSELEQLRGWEQSEALVEEYEGGDLVLSQCP